MTVRPALADEYGGCDNLCEHHLGSSNVASRLAVHDIQKLIRNCPHLHRRETEISAATSISVLGRRDEDQSCLHRTEDSLLEFLRETVKPDHQTIETGCGLSTIVFSVLARHHVCITPNREETDLMLGYLAQNGIDTRKLRVITEDSADALPSVKDRFQVGLVDGKHAYPWPIIDWFYISDRLLPDGVMVLDDLGLEHIGRLDGFLRDDANWRAAARGRRWAAHRKVGDVRHSVWHLQPLRKSPRQIARELARRLIGR